MAASKRKTRGLILREMTLGESDRLITVLTEDMGVIRAFARRAKNLTDSKNAATGLLCYSRLDLYEGRERYIINSAVPIEAFFGLRSDITALALGQYLCQFAEELVPEAPDSGEYLRVILNALHFLSQGASGEGGRPQELIKALVELRMLSMSGFMPNLIGCASCGAYESERMFFRVSRGELYCKDCYLPKSSPAVGLSPPALGAMRQIVLPPLEKAFAFTLKGAPLKELSDAAEAYSVSVLQKRLKTLDFYNSLLT